MLVRSDRMLPVGGSPIAATKPTALPALDGLRGLAALMVLAYHVLCQVRDVTPSENIRATLEARYEQFSVLSTGVQLFFVLSGFLLFLPYARAIERGGAFPSTREFYRRRALRILPAYWITLIAMTLLVSKIHKHDLILHWLLLNNLRSDSFYSINTVFWTLAIEWQFYLLLPGMAYVIWRLAMQRRRRTIVAAVSLIFAMALVAGYLANVLRQSPDEFYSPLAYLPAFLPIFVSGAIAAWYYVRWIEFGRRRSDEIRRRALWMGILGAGTVAGLVGLAGCGVMVFNRMTPHFWMYGNLVLGAGYSLIVFGAACGGRGMKLLFENRPIRYVGMISFSLYMWHVKLLDFFNPAIYYRGNSWGVVPIAVALTLLVTVSFSAGFYQLIEKPFLAMKNRKSRFLWMPSAKAQITVAQLPAASVGNADPHAAEIHATATFLLDDRRELRGVTNLLVQFGGIGRVL